jgi:hypothetical protein
LRTRRLPMPVAAAAPALLLLLALIGAGEGPVVRPPILPCAVSRPCLGEGDAPLADYTFTLSAWAEREGTLCATVTTTITDLCAGPLTLVPNSRVQLSSAQGPIPFDNCYFGVPPMVDVRPGEALSWSWRAASDGPVGDIVVVSAEPKLAVASPEIVSFPPAAEFVVHRDTGVVEARAE